MSKQDGMVKKHEKHSWELWGKKENSLTEDNKNNDKNLIFIIMTITGEVVIMTGHPILSSAL